MKVLFDDELHLDDLRAAFRVQVDEAGLRLDVVLVARLGVGVREVRRLVAEGRVRVDGRAVLAGAPRLTAGAVVAVLGEGARPGLLAERIPLVVLYQGPHLLVVNKPAMMPVIPGFGHPAGTLANALRGLGGALSGCEGPLRPGIVHRLDAGTSGVLLVARDDGTHRRLAAAFATRAAHRHYLALVRGEPAWDETVVDAPLGPRRAGRKAQGVRPDGRPARTRLVVLERFGQSALVACEPETGRTHQIRVHLAHLGHPLVGDTLYGGGAAAAYGAARLGLRRPALHAARLTIPGEALDVTAPVPADLELALRSLRGSRADRC